MTNTNRTISLIGSMTVTVTVFLFALCMITNFTFGSYFVCIFLALGYIITAAGFQHESDENRRVSANIGFILSAVYAVLIMVVYFTQLTSVRLEELSDQASRALDYSRGGLLFNLDLLGYGIMALSTFFIGLSIKAENKSDKWLKCLMMVHGIFFVSCFIMPMTGMFTRMAGVNHGNGGTIALLFWCAYFLPIGILSFIHFKKQSDCIRFGE